MLEIKKTFSVIPFDFSSSSQFIPYPIGIEIILLKNAVIVEESQRDVKKVHILHAILARPQPKIYAQHQEDKGETGLWEKHDKEDRVNLLLNN